MIYHCKECDEHRHFEAIEVLVVPDSIMSDEFTLARCKECGYPSLFIRQDWSGDGFDDDEYYRVYPAHERALNFKVPPLVKDSYNEAMRCETHKLWTACVVMVGRTLEAVAKEHMPEVKNMAGGLAKMLSAGIISKELYDWSSELRVLRNFGAHVTAQKITAQDAKESMDFLRAILETIYHMRPKFKQMQERRAGGQGKTV